MEAEWMPWIWAAGAAACAAMFLTIQPWRAEAARGWRLAGEVPAAWLWPCGLIAVDAIGAAWAGKVPGFPDESAWFWCAGSLVQVWHGFNFGAAAGLLTGLMLAVNAGGLRRGFLRGVESVSGYNGNAALVLVLSGGVALVGNGIWAGQGVPVVWQMVVTALAVPLVGWLAAVVLAGLLLLAETRERAPEKVKEVRWLETSAAHAARLWPWAIGHGVAWWLGLWVDLLLPDGALPIVVGLWWLAGLSLAFAPLVFLHVKNRHLAPEGWADSLRLWLGKGWQVLVHAAVAGLVFFLWWLAGRALDHVSRDAADGVRILLASFHRAVHIGLTVMGLGAWVALRLAGAPPPARPARTRRVKSP